MPLDLYREFRAILDALEEDGVEYAVVGALALAVHGVARATQDIALLIRPGDLDATLASVARCGFDLPAEPMTFTDSGVSIQRVSKADPEGLLTLDLLLSGPTLQHVWDSRERVDTTEGGLWVASRAGLMKMKAASGRLRDLADIRALEEGDDG